jgi:polysaccharide chain length determinant protein (PEP-CTERM system associated)
MQDLFEKLLDEFRGAWRFRWVAMLVAWIVALGGWAVVLAMPDTYEATARVFVDSRTMLSQVTQGIAVDTNIDTQIQRVRQAILGGPQIEKVAREAFPDFSTGTPEQRQLIVSKLRDRITITGSASRENPTAGSYLISYTDESRDRSLQIVDRLLNTFMEGSLGGNREDTKSTQRFLDEQIASTEQSLREAEQKLRDFKTKYVGLMPGAQGDYFQRLQAEMNLRDQAKSSYAVASSQRDELRTQLTSEEPFLNGGTSLPYAGTSGPVAGNDTASQIRETQRKLDDLLLRYTEKHPDVEALRQTLEDLKARQREELDAVKRGDQGAAGRLGLTSNPVYMEIQKQLNQKEVEIAALAREIADHEHKIAELNKLVKTAPEVEAEFVNLNRDYKATQQLYDDLAQRRNRVRLSEQADETGKKSTFLPTDPPRASLFPVAPNRPRLIIMVLFAAFAVGGGLAYLLYQLKPVFSSPRQLSEVTGLPVLGAVNMIWLGRYTAAARRGAIAYAAMVVMLVAAGVVMFVVQSQATRALRELVG